MSLPVLAGLVGDLVRRVNVSVPYPVSIRGSSELLTNLLGDIVESTPLLITHEAGVGPNWLSLIHLGFYRAPAILLN